MLILAHSLQYPAMTVHQLHLLQNTVKLLAGKPYTRFTELIFNKDCYSLTIWISEFQYITIYNKFT